MAADLPSADASEVAAVLHRIDDTLLTFLPDLCGVLLDRQVLRQRAALVTWSILLNAHYRASLVVDGIDREEACAMAQTAWSLATILVAAGDVDSIPPKEEDPSV